MEASYIYESVTGENKNERNYFKKNIKRAPQMNIND